MPITKPLAQDYDLAIMTTPSPDAGVTPAVFTHIGGLTGVTYSPSKSDVDQTDMDSGSWGEHLPVRRTASWSATGHRKEDPVTGARDPGQEAVEGYQNEVGAAAIATFQYTSPSGYIIEYDASVNVTPYGGSNDAIATWNVDMTMSGAPRLASAP
jgi:hypothetical protein